MKLVGYARTSTEDQVAGLDAQIRDLTAAGCDVIYNERVSSVGERPEFEAALRELEPGDTLVVTKMDRLARKVVDLLELVEDFNKTGRALRILNMGGDVVDTRSATGRLLLSLLASVAQFEREIMLERQREGIAKARAEGKYRGRVPTAARRSAEIVQVFWETGSVSVVSKRLGVSRPSIYRILTDEGVPYGPTVVRDPRRGVTRGIRAPRAAAEAS